MPSNCPNLFSKFSRFFIKKSIIWLSLFLNCPGYTAFYFLIFSVSPFSYEIFFLIEILIFLQTTLIFFLANQESNLIFKKNSIYKNILNILPFLNKIQIIYLDGIGTLTKKKVKVKKIIGNSQQYWNIVASLCEFSTHHIPQSIIAHQKYKSEKKKISQVKEIIGTGLTAIYHDKKKRVQISLSSIENMIANGISISKKMKTKANKITSNLADSSQENYTIASFSYNGSVRLIFALKNQIRTNALLFIKQLKKNYPRTSFYILSGENQKVTRYLSTSLNTDGFFANCSPEKKEKIIKKSTKKKICCFIGDSANDIKGMKRANISILFSSAKNTQLIDYTPDIIIHSDNILDISYALATAKKIKRIFFLLLVFTITFNLQSLLFLLPI